MLMGQMIRGDRGGGGSSGGEGSQANVNDNTILMIKEQQDKLRTDYENRLADLERERETIEEEKAQVMDCCWGCGGVMGVGGSI